MNATFCDCGNTMGAAVGSKLIVSWSGMKVIVRDLFSGEVLQVQVCNGKVDSVSLSSSGNYYCCLVLSKSLVQVFDTRDSNWKCSINEGVAGLKSVSWVPGSDTYVITESDYGIQLCIWSLVDETTMIIANPKQMTSGSSGTIKSFAFSKCNQFLAVIHRFDLQDYIGIYTVSSVSWTEINKFKCASNDAMFVSWLPDSTHLVVCDSPLNYKICVYLPSGELKMSYNAYDYGLGIRCIDISSEFIAIASFDGKVRLLSTKVWRSEYTLTCSHPKDMTLENSEENAFSIMIEEPIENNSSLGNTTALNNTINLMIYTNCVFNKKSNIRLLPKTPIDPLKPQMGVNWTKFDDHKATFMACREESYPRCLWIWEYLKPLSRPIFHCLVVSILPITCAVWRPMTCNNETARILAYCNGSTRVYFWESTDCSISWLDISQASNVQPFAILSVRWDTSGSRIIIQGKESCCIATPNFKIKNANV